METKVCSKCKEELPISSFHIADKNNGRRRGDCGQCCYEAAKVRREKNPDDFYRRRRATIIRHKYGMEMTVYDSLLVKQDGACAICKRTVDYLLHVDHDHATGAVRGLLCRPCNTGIGMLNDDEVTLQNAIVYLRGSESD